MADHLADIDACANPDDLKVAFTAAYQFVVKNGDIESQKRIIACKDARKKALAESQK
jgi:hypothetical protein